MVEEAKEVLQLPPSITSGLKGAQDRFDVVVLLFKSFEKAKLEPPPLRLFAWTMFILARGKGEAGRGARVRTRRFSPFCCARRPAGLHGASARDPARVFGFQCAVACVAPLPLPPAELLDGLDFVQNMNLLIAWLRILHLNLARALASPDAAFPCMSIAHSRDPLGVGQTGEKCVCVLCSRHGGRRPAGHTGPAGQGE